MIVVDEKCWCRSPHMYHRHVCVPREARQNHEYESDEVAGHVRYNLMSLLFHLGITVFY